jgi:hypothetical protein
MNRIARLSIARLSWIAGLALLPLPFEAAAAETAASSATPRTPVVCDASVQHPIQVKVEALDPIRRGAAVRLRLTANSRVLLGESEARVVSTGGASLMSKPSASLGRMGPDRGASTEFAVAVPQQGKRFLVEFRIEGEGPAGRISRGASFNLLPDGPTAPARIVAGEGGLTIAEYPARRISR